MKPADDTKRSMSATAVLLRRIGEALHGERCQTGLSEDLDVADRSVRRWINEGYPVPKGVWKELFIKLDMRKDEIDFLIGRAKEMMDTTPK